VNYILGIDQGGTKTAAIILNCEGVILGLGISKGAYHTSDGLEYAMSAVSEAIKIAEESSQIKLSQISSLVAGMTGMDWPHERKLLKVALKAITGIENIEVHNDCIIAMYGGLNKSCGAVLCAGTGLNSAIISPSGEEYILGFYIDDDVQGGSALGKRAVRQVLDSEIGLCPNTKLKDMVLDYFKKKDIEEFLYYYATSSDSFEVKNLAPKIIDIASSGDEVAITLVSEFAKDMCKYVYAGLKKYNMLGLEIDVVLSGSIFKGEKNLMRDAVTNYIKDFAPKASIVNAKYEPVVGAGIMGLMAINNYSLSKEMEDNLANTAAIMNLYRGE